MNSGYWSPEAIDARLRARGTTRTIILDGRTIAAARATAEQCHCPACEVERTGLRGPSVALRGTPQGELPNSRTPNQLPTDGECPRDGTHRSRIAATIAALALALTLGHVSAHEAPQPDLWPIIGTPAYDSGCVITQAWDDGSAIAYCYEDNATYYYDPDGLAFMDHGILFRDTSQIGWHAR